MFRDQLHSLWLYLAILTMNSRLFVIKIMLSSSNDRFFSNTQFFDSMLSEPFTFSVSKKKKNRKESLATLQFIMCSFISWLQTDFEARNTFSIWTHIVSVDNNQFKTVNVVNITKGTAQQMPLFDVIWLYPLLFQELGLKVHAQSNKIQWKPVKPVPNQYRS